MEAKKGERPPIPVNSSMSGPSRTLHVHRTGSIDLDVDTSLNNSLKGFETKHLESPSVSTLSTIQTSTSIGDSMYTDDAIRRIRERIESVNQKDHLEANDSINVRRTYGRASSKLTTRDLDSSYASNAPYTSFHIRKIPNDSIKPISTNTSWISTNKRDLNTSGISDVSSQRRTPSQRYSTVMLSDTSHRLLERVQSQTAKLRASERVAAIKARVAAARQHRSLEQLATTSNSHLNSIDTSYTDANNSYTSISNRVTSSSKQEAPSHSLQPTQTSKLQYDQSTSPFHNYQRNITYHALQTTTDTTEMDDSDTLHSNLEDQIPESDNKTAKKSNNHSFSHHIKQGFSTSNTKVNEMSSQDIISSATVSLSSATSSATSNHVDINSSISPSIPVSSDDFAISTSTTPSSSVAGTVSVTNYAKESNIEDSLNDNIIPNQSIILPASASQSEITSFQTSDKHVRHLRDSLIDQSENTSDNDRSSSQYNSKQLDHSKSMEMPDSHHGDLFVLSQSHGTDVETVSTLRSSKGINRDYKREMREWRTRCAALKRVYDAEVSARQETHALYENTASQLALLRSHIEDNESSNTSDFQLARARWESQKDLLERQLQHEQEKTKDLQEEITRLEKENSRLHVQLETNSDSTSQSKQTWESKVLALQNQIQEEVETNIQLKMTIDEQKTSFQQVKDELEHTKLTFNQSKYDMEQQIQKIETEASNKQNDLQTHLDNAEDTIQILHNSIYAFVQSIAVNFSEYLDSMAKTINEPTLCVLFELMTQYHEENFVWDTKMSDTAIEAWKQDIETYQQLISKLIHHKEQSMKTQITKDVQAKVLMGCTDVSNQQKILQTMQSSIHETILDFSNEFKQELSVVQTYTHKLQQAHSDRTVASKTQNELLQKKYSTLEARFENLQQEKEQLFHQYTSLETEVRTQEQTIEDISKEKESIKSDNKLLQEKINELQQTTKDCQELEERIQLLQEDCQTKEQKIHTLSELHEEKITQLSHEHNQHLEEFTKIKENQMEELSIKVQNFENKVSDLQVNISSLEEHLLETQNERDALQTRSDTLQKQYNTVTESLEAERTQWNEQQNEYETKLQMLQTMTEDLESDKTDMQEVNQHLSQRLHRLESSVQDLRGKYAASASALRIAETHQKQLLHQNERRNMESEDHIAYYERRFTQLYTEHRQLQQKHSEFQSLNQMSQDQLNTLQDDLDSALSRIDTLLNQHDELEKRYDIAQDGIRCRDEKILRLESFQLRMRRQRKQCMDYFENTIELFNSIKKIHQTCKSWYNDSIKLWNDTQSDCISHVQLFTQQFTQNSIKKKEFESTLETYRESLQLRMDQNKLLESNLKTVQTNYTDAMNTWKLKEHQLETEIERLQKETIELNTKNTRLVDELAASKQWISVNDTSQSKTITQLEMALTQSKEQNESNQKELREAESTINTLETRIERMTQEMQHIQKELDNVHDQRIQKTHQSTTFDAFVVLFERSLKSLSWLNNNIKQAINRTESKSNLESDSSIQSIIQQNKTDSTSFDFMYQKLSTKLFEFEQQSTESVSSLAKVAYYVDEYDNMQAELTDLRTTVTKSIEQQKSLSSRLMHKELDHQKLQEQNMSLKQQNKLLLEESTRNGDSLYSKAIKQSDLNHLTMHVLPMIEITNRTNTTKNNTKNSSSSQNEISESSNHTALHAGDTYSMNSDADKTLGHESDQILDHESDKLLEKAFDTIDELREELSIVRKDLVASQTHSQALTRLLEQNEMEHKNATQVLESLQQQLDEHRTSLNEQLSDSQQLRDLSDARLEQVQIELDAVITERDGLKAQFDHLQTHLNDTVSAFASHRQNVEAITAERDYFYNQLQSLTSETISQDHMMMSQPNHINHSQYTQPETMYNPHIHDASTILSDTSYKADSYDYTSGPGESFAELEVKRLRQVIDHYEMSIQQIRTQIANITTSLHTSQMETETTKQALSEQQNQVKVLLQERDALRQTILGLHGMITTQSDDLVDPAAPSVLRWKDGTHSNTMDLKSRNTTKSVEYLEEIAQLTLQQAHTRIILCETRFEAQQRVLEATQRYLSNLQAKQNQRFTQHSKSQPQPENSIIESKMNSSTTNDDSSSSSSTDLVPSQPLKPHMKEASIQTEVDSVMITARNDTQSAIRRAEILSHKVDQYTTILHDLLKRLHKFGCDALFAIGMSQDQIKDFLETSHTTKHPNGQSRLLSRLLLKTRSEVPHIDQNMQIQVANGARETKQVLRELLTRLKRAEKTQKRSQIPQMTRQDYVWNTLEPAEEPLQHRNDIDGGNGHDMVEENRDDMDERTNQTDMDARNRDDTGKTNRHDMIERNQSTNMFESEVSIEYSSDLNEENTNGADTTVLRLIEQQEKIEKHLDRLKYDFELTRQQQRHRYNMISNKPSQTGIFGQRRSQEENHHAFDSIRHSSINKDVNQSELDETSNIISFGSTVSSKLWHSQASHPETSKTTQDVTHIQTQMNQTHPISSYSLQDRNFYTNQPLSDTEKNQGSLIASSNLAINSMTDQTEANYPATDMNEVVYPATDVKAAIHPVSDLNEAVHPASDVMEALHPTIYFRETPDLTEEARSKVHCPPVRRNVPNPTTKDLIQYANTPQQTEPYSIQSTQHVQSNDFGSSDSVDKFKKTKQETRRMTSRPKKRSKRRKRHQMPIVIPSAVSISNNRTKSNSRAVVRPVNNQSDTRRTRSLSLHDTILHTLSASGIKREPASGSEWARAYSTLYSAISDVRNFVSKSKKPPKRKLDHNHKNKVYTQDNIPEESEVDEILQSGSIFAQKVAHALQKADISSKSDTNNLQTHQSSMQVVTSESTSSTNTSPKIESLAQEVQVSAKLLDR